MTTIINTPPSKSGDEGLGLGIIVGIVLVILAGIVFFIYGIPMLKATEEAQPTTQKIEIQLPADTSVTTPAVTE